ncbi:MAG: hypothetical protein P9M06_01185 [Candidatus Saelkia tenebricola]|nr:hypothetical protein [Candidatus Saelkia tenebricola]
MPFVETTDAILGYLFAILLLDGLGKVVLPKKRFDFFFLRISFGVIICSIVLTILGLLSLLNQNLILILAVGTYLLLFKTIKLNLLNYLKPYLLKKTKLKLTSLFFLLIAAYIVIIHINALTPPLSRDALNYHLYLPKIYLEQNRILTIPNNIYSFFPAYWEVFYTFLLTISSDITAKLFHALFLILTISLIANILRLLKPDLKEIDIGCASLIFISTPSITKIVSWAYLDITFSFYCLLSLYLILKFYKEQHTSFYYLAAISMGFALGMKYTGWIWILCLGLILLEKKGDFKKTLLPYLKFISIAAAIASPFYIRNLFVTGNPFYPFFYPLFGGTHMNLDKYTLLGMYFRSYGEGVDLKSLLFLPYRILFRSEFAQPHNFDGKIGFLYLLGLIPVFKNIRFKFSPKSILYIVIVYTLFWFILSQQIRLLIPALTLITIIYGLYLSKSNKKYIHYLILVAAFFYLFYPIQDFYKLKSYKPILGRETREEFLRRNLRIYPMIEFINKNLPTNSKVMLFDIGAIAYYVDRKVFQESIFEDYTFKLNLRISAYTAALYLRENQVDFILTDEEFLNTYVIPTLEARELENLKIFYSKHIKAVCQYQNFVLYQLISI